MSNQTESEQGTFVKMGLVHISLSNILISFEIDSFIFTNLRPDADEWTHMVEMPGEVEGRFVVGNLENGDLFFRADDELAAVRDVTEIDHHFERWLASKT